MGSALSGPPGWGMGWARGASVCTPILTSLDSYGVHAPFYPEIGQGPYAPGTIGAVTYEKFYSSRGPLRDRLAGRSHSGRHPRAAMHSRKKRRFAIVVAIAGPIAVSPPGG